jgi:hypothetical protein
VKRRILQPRLALDAAFTSISRAKRIVTVSNTALRRLLQPFRNETAMHQYYSNDEIPTLVLEQKTRV